MRFVTENIETRLCQLAAWRQQPIQTLSRRLRYNNGNRISRWLRILFSSLIQHMNVTNVTLDVPCGADLAIRNHQARIHSLSITRQASTAGGDANKWRSWERYLVN